MKLIFFGSRSLKNDKVKEIIDTEVKKHNPEYVITSGETYGVCELARNYCRKNGIPLILFFLKEEHGPGMYHHRSKNILKEGDYCILIHDGESTGTKNELDLAQKMGVEYAYYRLDKEAGIGEISVDWTKQQGFRD